MRLQIWEIYEAKIAADKTDDENENRSVKPR